MHVKKYFAGMAGVVALLLMGANGFAAPPIEQPPQDQLHAECGGNAERIVPDSARGSQKCVQGR